MYALTNKKFYNLEENKQKREEMLKKERKMEDMKLRKEKVKELDGVNISILLSNIFIIL